MKRYSMETAVGVFVVIGLVCVAYMTIKLGKVSLLGGGYYSLYAEFTSVSGLREGNAIEMDGIEVGRVQRLRIDQQKQMAVVELKIRDDIKVYDDATASIKTSGLIGDKYIKVEPGGGGSLLKPGSRIIDTTSPVDLEELIGKYVFGDVTKNAK
jgi:phospholipid/cholesterol/gamma-HCH transport system substrate-binding protein